MINQQALFIPADRARVEIRVVNSRFIADAGPTPTVEAARNFIAAIRAETPDATHHVYAYIIGHGATTTLGMSDDGEPSGTAGRPVLAVLRGSGLGDITVVVTRYFGGTLLGTVGLFAGFRGGWIDALLMRFAEIVYSFPSFLFFIIVMAALKDTPIGKFWNGFLILFGALSLVGWVDVARLVRGQILSLKEKEFIEAARAIGVRQHNILIKHLLPNSLGPIIISAAFIIPGAIITEAILAYLGIGVRPATDLNAAFPVSWGNMILDGREAISSQPWLLIAPAVAIATVTLAFTFIGDGLRDALDPREAQ